jgi:tetratricopeptide (TPR) repeat protein
MDDRIQRVWERLQQGRHTLVIGARSITPPDEPAICVVRVNCARWERPLGPMLEARDKLEEMVRDTRAPILIGGMGSDALLNRELLEDEDGRADGHLVGLANRLQRQVDMPVVVMLEAIEEADDVTLALVLRMVRAESGLKVALLLTAGSDLESTRPSVQAVLQAMGSRLGAEAVVDLDAPVEAIAPPAEVPPAEVPSVEVPFDSLRVEVLRVLRAGATVGTTFEADVVGELLGLDVLTTLELLQLATDGGCSIDDLGDGVFRLPTAYADRLRQSVTPSLASAWHGVLAQLLGEPEEPSDEADTKRLAARDPDRASRAAEHAEAAGERDAAAEQYLEAAERAASLGAHGHALELLERCLAALTATAPTRPRRLLRLRALLSSARIKWHAAGDENEAYSLEDAASMLDDAGVHVRADDPVDLVSQIAILRARIDYDIGGRERLQQALGHLDEARVVLLDAGLTADAARLLNDEAAIRARLGEFQRAAQLLQRSRDTFARASGPEPVREIAETDLLAARLMLHAPEEHQRDPESRRLALDAAHNAERAYQRLGDHRQRARAWETLARLEMLSERPEPAMQYLRSAMGVQEQLGDVVGLARTTAALAEVMTAGGMHQEALQLLSDSVNLNRMKGSLQGLGYNRKGLDELVAKLPPEAASRLGGPIEELRSNIEELRRQLSS